MKYEIIKDLGKLEAFINWLPDLQNHEKFYIALFARKKYDSILQSTSTDKMQLKRILSDKEHMVDKIKQLEIDYGLYKLKNTVATQESLALYITPNPRCMIKAHNDLLLRTAKAITTGNYFYNLHSETMSCIQRSKAKSYIVDFDIDDKEIDISLIKNILIEDCYDILETRGGYHILVNPKKASEVNKQIQERKMLGYETKYPFNWHKAITALFKCDQVGDQMIPVPGCTQGNFIPQFVKI